MLTLDEEAMAKRREAFDAAACPPTFPGQQPMSNTAELDPKDGNVSAGGGLRFMLAPRGSLCRLHSLITLQTFVVWDDGRAAAEGTPGRLEVTAQAGTRTNVLFHAGNRTVSCPPTSSSTLPTVLKTPH